MYLEIPIEKIIVPEQRRKLRDIKPLAESIDENGLLHPIIVSEDYQLIAGLHRLRACEALNWKEVPVSVLKVDEIDAQLAEIDENLIRNELTTIERGELLERRKRIYEAKYPSTRHGGDRRSQERNDSSFIKLVPSFASNVAQQTRFSPRTIRQEIYIAKNLDPEVRDAVRDTPLAIRKYDLLKLCRLSSEEQHRVAEKAIANPDVEMDKIIQQDAVETTLSQIDDQSKMPGIKKVGTMAFLDTVAPKSADLLVTNPPASTISESNTLRDWVPHALSRIKDTGHAYILSSSEPGELQTYLEVLSVEPRFKIEKILVWPLQEQLPINASIKTYRSTWRAIFYLRGVEAKHFDCPIPDEQNVVQTPCSLSELAERLVRHSSKNSDTVLDPFAGNGTILLAAAHLGRKSIGCELEEKALEAAERAGCLVTE